MTYTIHPVAMGTKVFDKSMMTYQYGQGETYTIPIFCWVIKGGDKNILVDTGEMNPIQSDKENRPLTEKSIPLSRAWKNTGLHRQTLILLSIPICTTIIAKTIINVKMPYSMYMNRNLNPSTTPTPWITGTWKIISRMWRKTGRS